MDVDFLNSPTEAQMEVMAMMMQMEKLAEFSAALHAQPPTIAFSSGPTHSEEQYYNDPSSPQSPAMLGLPPKSFSLSGTDASFPPPIPSTTQLSFASSNTDPSQSQGHSRESVAAMREMIFRIAAMQPIHIDPESVKPPKRRNVKTSKDPQSIAARHRRERISERIRILQRLVPGGTKMDTASMLDEAIHYVKFLKTQVQSLERAAASRSARLGVIGSFGSAGTSSVHELSGGNNYLCFGSPNQSQGFIDSAQMLS